MTGSTKQARPLSEQKARWAELAAKARKAGFAVEVDAFGRGSILASTLEPVARLTSGHPEQYTAWEAPTWDNVQAALAVFLFGATGKPSSLWLEVLDDLTTQRGPLSNMRALLDEAKGQNHG